MWRLCASWAGGHPELGARLLGALEHALQVAGRLLLQHAAQLLQQARAARAGRGRLRAHPGFPRCLDAQHARGNAEPSRHCPALSSSARDVVPMLALTTHIRRSLHALKGLRRLAPSQTSPSPAAPDGCLAWAGAGIAARCSAAAADTLCRAPRVQRTHAWLLLAVAAVLCSA